jgi:Fe2+ or Zn2+ uptake regulation protein
MGYLGEHPRAMDNVQGIAEWWVARQQVKVDVETVARVLQQLAAEGVLEEVDSAEGPFYRLSR